MEAGRTQQSECLINRGHCGKKAGFEISNLVSLGQQLQILPRPIGHSAVSKDLRRDPLICRYGAELLGADPLKPDLKVSLSTASLAPFTSSVTQHGLHAL